MYRVYRNKAAAAYLFLYFFIYLPLQFSKIKIFCHTLLTNSEAKKIETRYTHGQWADVLCIPESGYSSLFIPLFLHFLSLQFSNIKNFSSHFSQELWGLEGWNMNTWTMGGCIVCTRIRQLLHICPFIFSFFFLSNFQKLKCFCHTLYPRGQWLDELCIPKVFITFFIRSGRYKKLKQYKVTNMKNKYNVLCILKSGCSYFFIPFFLPFSVSPIYTNLSFSSDSAIVGL